MGEICLVLRKLLNFTEFPLPWMVGAADGADQWCSFRVGRDFTLLLEMGWLRVLDSLVLMTVGWFD